MFYKTLRILCVIVLVIFKMKLSRGRSKFKISQMNPLLSLVTKEIKGAQILHKYFHSPTCLMNVSVSRVFLLMADFNDRGV